MGHGSGIQQPPQQRRVGRPPALGGVGAQAQRREERALEVGADDARTAAVDRHRAQGGHEAGLRRGDERRLKGGDAGGQQRRAGTAVALAVGALEVDAGEAVDLQVHESRRGDAASAAADAERTDDAVHDVHVARHEGAVDQRRGHAEPHGYIRRNDAPLTSITVPLAISAPGEAR